MTRDCEKAKSTEMIGFSRSAISVLNGAEPSITETPNSDLILMDVDQSFLPAPSLVKAAIFESFAGQNMSESEIDVTPSASPLLYPRRWTIMLPSWLEWELCFCCKIFESQHCEYPY
ncbi:hypothetical protein WN943_005883 [Citrus x changshan-huyou]